MDKVEVLLEPVRVFLRQLGDLVPRVLLALLVLLVGWLLAKGVRYAVSRGLRAMNFQVLTERAGIDGFLRNGGVRADTTEILAILCYWAVILAALIIGFNSLGLVYVTELLTRVVLFVPKVAVAVLILSFGTYFAAFVGNAICAYLRNIDVHDAELLGRIAQYAIVAFVVLISLDQVGVGGEIVRQTFLVILAGAVAALALAFGLAGKEWAADLLERWWPRRK